jgi:uncharacterized protein (TIGR02996 family)
MGAGHAASRARPDVTEARLLRSVLAAPDEDEPRLVYADWLMEQGDPRGELIIVQCRLQDRSLTPTERAALERQERALLVQNKSRWLAPLGLTGGEGHFVRGFVERLEGWGERLCARMPALADQTPLRSVQMHRLSTGHLAALVDGLQELPHLTALHLDSTLLGAELGRALARLPARLTTLHLSLNNLGDEGARALAASACLGALTHLDLASNGMSDEGARALAESPALARLQSLGLGLNHIGADGARALASSPHLRALTHLGLGSNRIGPDGARALAESRSFERLSSLHLHRSGLGDAGVRALAESPHLGSLTELVLWENSLGDEGARALARSPHLDRLIWLDLRDHTFGDEVQRELKDRFGDRVLL